MTARPAGRTASDRAAAHLRALDELDDVLQMMRADQHEARHRDQLSTRRRVPGYVSSIALAAPCEVAPDLYDTAGRDDDGRATAAALCADYCTAQAQCRAVAATADDDGRLYVGGRRADRVEAKLARDRDRLRRRRSA